MNMHWVDLLIVAVPLLVVFGIALKTHRHVRSVADFLAAGRCAGRYLICNAQGTAAFGAISAVAIFEMMYEAGFSMNWWSTMSAPLGLFLALSGFVIYRYRETRAMTLAQFLEIRYSRRFRIFAGLVTFVSGALNYGIFPAVGARFFVNYCGMPQTLGMFGATLPTFAVVMAVMLSTALALTLVGGQLTVMVTDCAEGLIAGVLYLVVAFALLHIFSWSQIAETMSNVPPGKSLLNPFDTSHVRDFNIWYVLIGMFGMVYGYMTWQGNQGFNCSAASPHEAKMGVILGQWRGFARAVMITLLAVCAYTFLNHPHFAAQADGVREAVSRIDNPQIQKQMLVPVALGHLLPMGIKGVFCAVMLFALLACDSSYLHSWGSIFIQDVVLPFRKAPVSPEQHIRLLRCSIFGVAAFAFLFSLLFRQTEYILMFFAVTGAIFGGGAGAVVVGGLYWKKGTTPAAWGAMITGSTLAVGGIIIKQIHPQFPVNGQVMYLFAMVAAVSVYVAVSLLTCQENFNMERMLHRGKYALASEEDQKPSLPRSRWNLGTVLGFDEHFTAGDKFISGGIFAWSMFWFGVFLVGCLWNLVQPWPIRWWVRYWHITGILMPLAIGLVTTIWFTLGGLRDLYRLFQRLQTVKRNALDDGTVIDHHNLGENSVP